MPATHIAPARLTLDHAEGNWESHQGCLREKPSITFAHNDGMFELGRQLANQLDRLLTVWRRQSNGRYVESLYHGGIVPLESLPGVNIDLDALFA